MELYSTLEGYIWAAIDWLVSFQLVLTPKMGLYTAHASQPPRVMMTLMIPRDSGVGYPRTGRALAETCPGAPWTGALVRQADAPKDGQTPRGAVIGTTDCMPRMRPREYMS